MAVRRSAAGSPAEQTRTIDSRTRLGFSFHKAIHCSRSASRSCPTSCFSDTNSLNCVTNTGSGVACGTQNPGEQSGFALNTDEQGGIKIKWLYTEFPVPLIPVPTVARLGAQPFGTAATYKLAKGFWGPTDAFPTICQRIGAPTLAGRARYVASGR